MGVAKISFPSFQSEPESEFELLIEEVSKVIAAEMNAVQREGLSRLESTVEGKHKDYIELDEKDIRFNCPWLMDKAKIKYNKHNNVDTISVLLGAYLVESANTDVSVSSTLHDKVVADILDSGYVFDHSDTSSFRGGVYKDHYNIFWIHFIPDEVLGGIEEGIKQVVGEFPDVSENAKKELIEFPRKYNRLRKYVTDNSTPFDANKGTFIEILVHEYTHYVFDELAGLREFKSRETGAFKLDVKKDKYENTESLTESFSFFCMYEVYELDNNWPHYSERDIFSSYDNGNLIECLIKMLENKYESEGGEKPLSWCIDLIEEAKKYDHKLIHTIGLLTLKDSVKTRIEELEKVESEFSGEYNELVKLSKLIGNEVGGEKAEEIENEVKKLNPEKVFTRIRNRMIRTNLEMEDSWEKMDSQFEKLLKAEIRDVSNLMHSLNKMRNDYGIEETDKHLKYLRLLEERLENIGQP